MGLFSKILNFSSEEKVKYGLTTDLHSHFLPGIDDGVKSFEEAIEVIKGFHALGVKKIITTPHIMGDFYKNTPEIINGKRDELRKILKEQNIEVQLEAAAEYYLDEFFLNMIQSKAPLLTFGDKYILVETSYMNASNFFHDVVFALKTDGYKPILAHPERYVYLYDDFDEFVALYQTGVFFQININSLSGYYSKESKFFAERLIDEKMVDFIGSDCHGIRHLEPLRKSISTKYYEKLLNLKLLNNEL